MSNHHIADVTCGLCAGRVTIRLGIASAIACPICGVVIQLGEGQKTVPARLVQVSVWDLDSDG